MNRVRPCLLAMLAAIATSATHVEAAARIGTVKKMKGSVSVDRDGEVRAVRMLGRRVRGGTLFSGNVVITGADSSAELALEDGSTMSVQADARVKIEEKKASFAKKLSTGKSHLRSITVLTGRILSKIRPNVTVATEFELPTGVAAVRGTDVDITVDGQTYNLAVQSDTANPGEYIMVVTDSFGNTTQLPTTAGITASPTADGTGIQISGSSTAGSAAVVSSQAGTNVAIGAGQAAIFTPSADGAGTQIQAVQGTITGSVTTRGTADAPAVTMNVALDQGDAANFQAQTNGTVVATNVTGTTTLVSGDGTQFGLDGSDAVTLAGQGTNQVTVTPAQGTAVSVTPPGGQTTTVTTPTTTTTGTPVTPTSGDGTGDGTGDGKTKGGESDSNPQ